MTENPIFTSWQPQHTKLWGNALVQINHRLHDDPLFSDQALERLLESYPREHYQLVQWGHPGGRRGFREGEFGRLSGKQILDSFQQAKIWINLRELHQVDPRYRRLLDAIFAELEAHLPGFHTRTRTMGILISSPGSRTYYHADLPGQSLWQLRGKKRIYLYPAAPPFISPEDLESIILSKVEGVAYEPWFDEHARVLDLEPGQMLTWPLNSPHRVDNHDCLNVSMTLEWVTPEIRRHLIVTRANAILRRTLGLRPRQRHTSGPGFWTKAVLQGALRRTPLLKRADDTGRKPAFRLDPAAPGWITDLPAE